MDVDRIQQRVTEYVGQAPRFRALRVLDRDEWRREVGEDSALFGGTAAIFTDDGEILVREGFEGDALHELVHAAGVHKNHGQSDFIMEGLAQAAAEDLGQKLGLPVRKTYKEETGFVRKYLVPVTGLSLKELVRGYASASDKAGFLADLIMARYGRLFTTEDWGQNAGEGLRRELHTQVGGYNPYLIYLVDEKRGGKRRHARPANQRNVVAEVNAMLRR